MGKRVVESYQGREEWGGRAKQRDREGKVIALRMFEKYIRNYITLWLLKINICIHTHTYTKYYLYIF